MDRKNLKTACNNAPVAGHFPVAVNGMITTKFLPSFNTSEIEAFPSGVKRIVKLPLAEVTKKTLVKLVAAVVAEQKYQLAVSLEKQFDEGWSTQIQKFGATAPVNLTGNANLDRDNIYNSLADKINASPRARANAKTLVLLDHAAANFMIGEVMTGATSGATGIIVSQVATGLQSIVAMTSENPFVVGENIDDVTGSGPAAIGTVTLGQGLLIEDNAGYYNAKGSRGGIATWLGTAGFAATDINPVTQIVEVIGANNAAWSIGAKITGDTSFAKGILLRKVSGIRSWIALIGLTNFAGETNCEDLASDGGSGTTDAFTSSTAAVATAENPGLPFFNYSFGQGARLLQDVPVFGRVDDNIQSGSITGPVGDVPASGVEYAANVWQLSKTPYNNGLDHSKGTFPLSVIYYVPLANQSAVDALLTAQGLTP